MTLCSERSWKRPAKTICRPSRTKISRLLCEPKPEGPSCYVCYVCYVRPHQIACLSSLIFIGSWKPPLRLKVTDNCRFVTEANSTVLRSIFAIHEAQSKDKPQWSSRLFRNIHQFLCWYHRLSCKKRHVWLLKNGHCSGFTCNIFVHPTRGQKPFGGACKGNVFDRVRATNPWWWHLRASESWWRLLRNATSSVAKIGLDCLDCCFLMLFGSLHIDQKFSDKPRSRVNLQAPFKGTGFSWHRLSAKQQDVARPSFFHFLLRCFWSATPSRL